MILANLRQRITGADVALVIRLLARGDADRRALLERRASAEGIDVLLDDPELPELLRTAPQLGSPSAPLFIYVMVRHSLRAASIDDVPLSDYLGALLFEFGFRDRAFRVARYDDEIYRYLADIVADLDVAAGRRGFLLRAHLGNFSLWLSGVFPDYVAARRERKGGPGFQYYEEMGAQGFRLAAAHQLARQHRLEGVYELAADSFRQIRVAFNRLSDGLFFPGSWSADRLLRQVADGFVS